LRIAKIASLIPGSLNGYQYAPIPYYETFGYDGFSNLTARQSQSWNGLTDDSDAATYTNNRRDGWGYDADGRNTTIDTRTNTFDAVGQQSVMTAQQVLWNGNHITVEQTGVRPSILRFLLDRRL